MKVINYKLGTVAPAAILALTCSASWADTFDTNPLIGTSGDGLIFSDPAEGVLEPGLKAVTFTQTRIPDGSGGFTYVDPFETVVTDFSTLDSRGAVPNCLMANNPDIYCDSEGGSGKRIKTQLTGRNPFDITLRTTASADHPSVDYFTFGKVSNFTGARMTGFSLELLDADGNPMGQLDPSNAVLFNLDAADIGLGARLPDGLFGAGGQEGEVGFFSDGRASLALTASDDVLTFGALSNEDYVANFGTGFIDNTMTPDGLFWDDNNDPADEAALVAWNNIAGGGWTYGTLGTDADIDARLAELASTLGVDVAALGYVDGQLVPSEIVALAEANGLFEVAEVEDLRNANLNYTMTVGTVDGGEVTLRIVPVFAPIVSGAQDDYQFQLAGYFDAAANVPYWDLGNAAEYQAAIADIMALPQSERATALNSVGFSYAPAFSSLGLEAARNQVSTITSSMPWGHHSGEGDAISSKGNANSWSMHDGLYGFAAVGGSQSSFSPTTGSVGYDIGLVSVTAGIEKHIKGAHASVGLAVGAASGSADAYQGLGAIDTDGFSLTAFTRAKFGQGGLVQALVGYQNLSYDSSRYVMGQTATGSTDGSQTFAALKLDYMKDMGAFKLGPIASLEYYSGSVDAFTETGAGLWNLDVAEQSADTLLASVGVRGEYQMPNTATDSRMTGSLEYTKASGDDMVLQSGFVGLPGRSFTIAGMDDDMVNVSFGFESVLSSNASRKVAFQGGYRGSFGSEYDSQQVQVGLNIRF